MTMRPRRRYAAAAALALAPALILGACSSSQPSGASGTAANDSVNGSSITFAMINGLVPQFQQYVNAYEKQYPSRKVTVLSLPDDSTQYIQQLSTEALAHKLPDVLFNVDTSANLLASANVTMDMSSWLAQGKDGLKGSSFLPQFLGEYRPVNDPSEITGLPVSADSVVLFYNKTILKDYDEPLPSPSWTWDDLYKVAADVQRKSGGKIAGLVAPLGTGQHPEIYNPVIHAYGGYVYNPKTNKSGIGEPAAIKAWTEMLKAYGTASPPYSANDSSIPNFQDGQAAMEFSVHATVPTLKSGMKDSWDVQTMPLINGNPTAGGGSYGLSIGKTSQHKNAAWAFLAWFYSQQGGMKLAQATGQVVPPTADGLAHGSWQDITPPPSNNQAFITAAKSAVLAVQLPGKAQGVLNSAVLTAIQQVELQHRSVQSAFTAAQTIVNNALAQSQ